MFNCGKQLLHHFNDQTKRLVFKYDIDTKIHVVQMILKISTM